MMRDRPEPSERVRALLQGGTDDDRMRQIARREVRTRMRALRKLVPADVVTTRSVRTCGRVNSMPQVTVAQVIVAYAAIHHEIDPMPAILHALSSSKTVGLPRVEPDGSISVLRYDGETLTPDHVGVLAPGPAAEPIELASIDVVLVPALAVDVRGHRLGYGRGFYDRLLSQIPNAITIALVHPFQVLVELADMPGDVPVNWIATETDIVPAQQG